jgi:hypothetical protein
LAQVASHVVVHRANPPSLFTDKKSARTSPTGFLSITAGAAKSIAPFDVPFSKLLPDFRDSGFTDAQSSQTECRSVHAPCAELLVATNADIKKQITCSEH